MVKKIIAIAGIVVLFVALVSSFTIYNNSVKIQNSLEILEEENEALLKDNENMEEVINSLEEEADENKKQMDALTNEFELEKSKGQETEQSLLEAENSLEEAVSLIDEIKEKLNTTIDPLVKIQQLTNENETLRNSLNNQNEETSSRNEEIIDPIDLIDYTDTFVRWKNDLEYIDGLLENRISELETIVSSLSELSMERIMIQSEIDFINNIREELSEVASEID